MAGLRLHLERAVGCLLEFAHIGVELQADAVLFHVAFDIARHFRIHRRHELIALLEYRNLEPQMDEVFGHLQPDETTTDHYRAFRRHYRLEPSVRVHPGGQGRVSFDPFADRPDVRHRSHPEDPRQIDAGQGRSDRRRTG